MQLVFSPTLCPDLLLPEVLDLAKAAGFSRLELFRAYTESTPVHRDWSVPMVRTAIADADLQLAGFNIRNLTGRKTDSDERNLAYNLRQLEWDIHLGRALGIKTLNAKGGARTDEALADLIEGVNTLLDNIPDIALNLGNHQGNRLQGLADYQAVMPELPERARVLLDTGPCSRSASQSCPLPKRSPGALVSSTCATSRAKSPCPSGKASCPLRSCSRC